MLEDTRLASLDAVVILAVQLKVPEPRLVAMLAPQLPLAYLAACFVVARARRGEVPDWRGGLARASRIAVAARAIPPTFRPCQPQAKISAISRPEMTSVTWSRPAASSWTNFG